VSFDEGLAVGLALGKKRFSGGGDSDKWTYPADWIQIPSPASNEVYCVGTISLYTSRTASVSFGHFRTDDPDYVGSIDWGDGVTTAITSSYMSHTYTDGTGHLTDSGMEQFLIKVTMEKPSLFGEVAIKTNSSYPFVLALAYGTETTFPENIEYYSSTSIHQIQLPDNTICPSIVGTYALKKIITPTKIVTPQNLNMCFSLEDIDLSEATSVNIIACHRIITLNLPKCKTAYIMNCYCLREINAPLLMNATIGNGYSLSKLVHADGATLNISNCPVLYPKT